LLEQARALAERAPFTPEGRALLLDLLERVGQRDR
jgi:hypothetical protein